MNHPQPHHDPLSPQTPVIKGGGSRHFVALIVQNGIISKSLQALIPNQKIDPIKSSGRFMILSF